MVIDYIKTIHLSNDMQRCTVKTGTKKEDVMSCVEYEIEELEKSPSEKNAENRGLKLVAVPRNQPRPSDQVTARVSEVLNLQLARGAMPA